MPDSANPPSPASPIEPPRQRPLLALSLRLAAGIGLATMFMLIKLGSNRGIELPQMIFIRQATAVVVLVGWLALRGKLAMMRTRRLRSHGLRAISGTIGMALNFTAPTLLPLAVATTFGFTTPIFAVVLSVVLLREQVGVWRWTATFLGFLGVFLLADPINASVPLLGAAIATGAAFMVALISIQIRDLGRTENSIAIVAWFAVFATPPLFVISLFGSWDIVPGDWIVLFAIGLSGVISQLLLTSSLRLGQVSSVIVMDFVTLIWATGYGWLIFDNLPPASLWLGAPLVIAAGAIIVWRESRMSKRPDQSLLE